MSRLHAKPQQLTERANEYNCVCANECSVPVHVPCRNQNKLHASRSRGNCRLKPTHSHTQLFYRIVRHNIIIRLHWMWWAHTGWHCVAVWTRRCDCITLYFGNMPICRSKSMTYLDIQREWLLHAISDERRLHRSELILRPTGKMIFIDFINLCQLRHKRFRVFTSFSDGNLRLHATWLSLWITTSFRWECVRETQRTVSISLIWTIATFVVIVSLSDQSFVYIRLERFHRIYGALKHHLFD